MFFKLLTYLFNQNKYIRLFSYVDILFQTSKERGFLLKFSEGEGSQFNLLYLGLQGGTIVQTKRWRPPGQE